MCIVETTTYNYSDGNTVTKQYLKPCTESRNGKACDFETYKDLGEKYIREIRPESYSHTSSSYLPASGKREDHGHSSSHRPNRQRDPRSHLTRGAEILLGTGREKKGKPHKKYHGEHQDDSYILSAATTEKLSRPSRLYSLSGRGLTGTTSEQPNPPPGSSQPGHSRDPTGRKINVPLSPPRSPGSPTIQRSGTAVYQHPSSPYLSSHPAPTYKVVTPKKPEKNFDNARIKPEKTFKKKIVIVDDARSQDNPRSRGNKPSKEHSSKTPKYVMSGALNFIPPGSSALSTPPITPEGNDTEYQDRMAARERERAKREAYNEHLQEEVLRDQHEERVQARHRHREQRREEKKRKDQQLQEMKEQKRRSRASSGSWDYEEESREEAETSSEKGRLREKREGKKPIYRTSPAASDPFPMGHPPPPERKSTKTSHHKYSHSVPIGHSPSDHLAATKEQMARELAASEARERQEALEDAAWYAQAQNQALFEAEKSAGYRLSPNARRYPDASAQSPTYRLDHMSDRRRLRRPSTADPYYDQVARGSPSTTPASGGATPSPYGQSHPYGSYGQYSPYDPYAASYSPSPRSPSAFQDLQRLPYPNHFLSGPDMRRERGARVLAEAAADEHRSRARLDDRTSLSSGFRDLRLGSGAGHSGKYAHDDNYGVRRASGGSGIRRRGTVSGDGRR